MCIRVYRLTCMWEINIKFPACNGGPKCVCPLKSMYRNSIPNQEFGGN